MHGYPQYKNPEPFTLDTDLSSTNKAVVLYQKQNGILWMSQTLVPPTRLQFFIRSRMVFLWVLPRNVTKLSILCPTQKRNDSHHHWIKEIQAHPKSQTLHHVHR